MCSTETVTSSTSSHLRPAILTTSHIAHLFCRRCCHSSKTFLPHLVLYCFRSCSDTRLVSSSLLFGERNQPAMFLPQKLYQNRLLNSMLNSYGTTPRPRDKHNNKNLLFHFTSEIKYSRPTFMGYKTPRLQLAVLTAHKGLPLIFYLLLRYLQSFYKLKG